MLPLLLLVPSYDLDSASCALLTTLEHNLLGSNCSVDPHRQRECFTEYEDRLAELRRAARAEQRGAPPECRLLGLGRNLCEAGRQFLPGTQPDVVSEAQNIYSMWMKQLTRHETRDKDCARFVKFHALRWNPLVFLWAEAGVSGAWDTAIVPWLRSAADYATAWAPAAEQTYYGPPEIAYVDARGAPIKAPPAAGGVGAEAAAAGRYRLKRYHEVEQARTFFHATGAHVRDVAQLVEFGGGGGELEAALRDLGFGGVHLVYDLPPMLLMQRFWLRHAALPVYTVGVDVPATALRPRLARGRTFQVSSVHKPAQLPLVLARTGVPLRDTAFWATWSFTEAGVAARNTVRAHLRGDGTGAGGAHTQPGRVFIAFWDDFKGVDNNAYLLEMVRADFAATHSLCVWRKKTHDPARPTYYLVMVHRELGTARCAAEVGCDETSKNHDFMRRAAPIPTC